MLTFRNTMINIHKEQASTTKVNPAKTKETRISPPLLLTRDLSAHLPNFPSFTNPPIYSLAPGNPVPSRVRFQKRVKYYSCSA